MEATRIIIQSIINLVTKPARSAYGFQHLSHAAAWNDNKLAFSVAILH